MNTNFVGTKIRCCKVLLESMIHLMVTISLPMIKKLGSESLTNQSFNLIIFNYLLNSTV